MSLAITSNATATPTTAHNTGAMTVTAQNMNWAADWALKSQNGSEVVLTNMRAPLDTRNQIRFQRREIANIYSGTGIAMNYQLPTRQGVSLLVQSTSTWAVSDSSDAQFRALLPFSAHMVIKVPMNNLLTGANIYSALSQLLGALFVTDRTDASDSTGLVRLLRGSTNPTKW